MIDKLPVVEDPFGILSVGEQDHAATQQDRQKTSNRLIEAAPQVKRDERQWIRCQQVNYR